MMTEQSPKPPPDLTQFDIRLLKGDDFDTASYRELRSNIRNSDGARNFADSYIREDQLDEPLWHEWCSAKREHCIIAAFDKNENNKLVSIMMITAQGPSDSLVAEWEATWVEPKYRGTGLARKAYDEVHRTTCDLNYQHAVVFIREDNHYSRGIREAQGFNQISTRENEHWADGSVANSNLFILDLHPPGLEEKDPFEHAIERLEKTLASLKGEAPCIEDAIPKRVAELRHEKTEGLSATYSRPKAALG